MARARDLADVGMTEEELDQYTPSNIVIHPGEYLREILEDHGWSATQAARALGVPRNRITLILNGHRGITADTAIRLARWLNTSPDFWLNLQKRYELRLAQVNADDKAYADIEPLETVTA